MLCFYKEVLIFNFTLCFLFLFSSILTITKTWISQNFRIPIFERLYTFYGSEIPQNTFLQIVCLRLGCLIWHNVTYVLCMSDFVWHKFLGHSFTRIYAWILIINYIRVVPNILMLVSFWFKSIHRWRCYAEFLTI